MVNYKFRSNMKRVLYKEIDRLLPFLSHRKGAVSLDLAQYDRAIADTNFFTVFAIDEDKPAPFDVVGMASILYKNNFMYPLAEIHDVVTEDAYRGKGIGRQMMEQLLRHARRSATYFQKSIQISLTSHPSRIVANELYVKLGFKLVSEAKRVDGVVIDGGTNFYKMDIRPDIPTNQ